MHELSIANSIVTTVLAEINRQQLPRVERVGVRVGALTAVVPEALQFNFEVITRNTVLANTRLQIEQVCVAGRCRHCGHEFAVENFVFVCPQCQSKQIDVTHGQELDITYLEVADS